MEKVTISFGTMVIVAAFVFVTAILGAALGGFSGWCCHFIFAATSAKLAVLTGFQPYQLGAIVGFVGGFFRASVTKKKEG